MIIDKETLADWKNVLTNRFYKYGDDATFRCAFMLIYGYFSGTEISGTEISNIMGEMKEHIYKLQEGKINA